MCNEFMIKIDYSLYDIQLIITVNKKGVALLTKGNAGIIEGIILHIA